MLLQRVTRKSLYRFRTSLGGSSSAGSLWQQFAMRIWLIPIRRNQNTEKEKPTLRIILNTHLTRNIVLHTTTIPTLHATPTHTTLTYSTLPHCITSHTLLPLHTTPIPCYINTPIPTHATHSRFIQQGFPLSLHNMLYSTPTIKRRNLPYLISIKESRARERTPGSSKQTQSHTHVMPTHVHVHATPPHHEVQVTGYEHAPGLYCPSKAKAIMIILCSPK